MERQSEKMQHQTTDLGVRGSTPLGSANLFKDIRVRNFRRRLHSNHLAITDLNIRLHLSRECEAPCRRAPRGRLASATPSAECLG